MTSGNYGPAQPNDPYAQQPQYGQQPGYGGSPAGYGPSGYGDAAAGPGAPGAPAQPGVYALALAAVSAVLGVLSFTALNWYSGKGDSKFSDVRDLVTNAQTKPYAAGMAKVYFGWLAWVLLAAVVVSAVLAALPNFTRVFRPVGAVLALVSVVITFIAVKFLNSRAGAISSQFRGYWTYLKHARLGFWTAVAAFVIGGIAALLGTRRPRPRTT